MTPAWRLLGASVAGTSHTKWRPALPGRARLPGAAGRRHPGGGRWRRLGRALGRGRALRRRYGPGCAGRLAGGRLAGRGGRLARPVHPRLCGGQGRRRTVAAGGRPAGARLCQHAAVRRAVGRGAGRRPAWAMAWRPPSRLRPTPGRPVGRQRLVPGRRAPARRICQRDLLPQPGRRARPARYLRLRRAGARAGADDRWPAAAGARRPAPAARALLPAAAHLRRGGGKPGRRARPNWATSCARSASCARTDDDKTILLALRRPPGWGHDRLQRRRQPVAVGRRAGAGRRGLRL